MLELFLTLIDKLTELVKVRHERNDKLFTEGVVAVFKDMETVHSDYLAMFEMAAFELKQGSGVGQVAETLHKHRLALETMRRTMKELATAFVEQAHLNDPYREFFRAVRTYFEKFDHVPELLLGRESTGSVEVLRLLEDAAMREEAGGLEDAARANIVHVIRILLVQLRKRWQGVATAFAAARVASLDL